MVAAESVGQRIKRERLAAQMTQSDLADAADIGVPYVSKIEADRENPSNEVLERIAEALDVDVDELFLVARRMPEAMLDGFAAEPARSLAFLRTWETAR